MAVLSPVPPSSSSAPPSLARASLARAPPARASLARASPLALPLALFVALLVTLSAALPLAAADEATVRLEERAGSWNGLSRVDLGTPAADAGEVLVWLPAGARVHQVGALVGDAPDAAYWETAGPDAILVSVPAGATAAFVQFDLPERRPNLVRYVSPSDHERATLLVLPEGERVPESASGSVVFDDAGAATLAPAPEGAAVTVRIVEAGRIGELPLLLTIGGFSLLVLVATLVWHRVRPPLGGRPPQKFLDHLSELQARILPVAVVFGLANLFYFASGLRAIDLGGIPFVAPTWGVDASISARAFDAVAERLVPAGVQLVVLRPADAVLAQVGMALFLSFATVLPLLVYELAVFIGPGLEPRERRVAVRVLPLITGLFLAGALLAYLVMAPLMIRTLYDYAPGIGATPLLAVGDLVSFALLIILALGVAFELPVVMYVLGRLGLVKATTFGKYVRHAILAIVVVAGLITPDPSVVSQLMLAVPIVVLYVLGIGAAAFGERASAAKAAAGRRSA